MVSRNACITRFLPQNSALSGWVSVPLLPVARARLLHNEGMSEPVWKQDSRNQDRNEALFPPDLPHELACQEREARIEDKRGHEWKLLFDIPDRILGPSY